MLPNRPRCRATTRSPGAHMNCMSSAVAVTVGIGTIGFGRNTNCDGQGPLMSLHELLVARVRGEYREMPGLRLTLAQACRLWQLDAATCELVLQTLLEENVLARTKDGAFAARSAEAHSTQVKATLRPAAAIVSHLRRPA